MRRQWLALLRAGASERRLVHKALRVALVGAIMTAGLPQAVTPRPAEAQAEVVRPLGERPSLATLLEAGGDAGPAYAALREMLDYHVLAADAPTLQTPANGSTLANLGPTLTWSVPTGTTQVHLQVIPSKNDGAGLNLILGADTSFAIPAPPVWYGMLPGMGYTWRARATSKATSADVDDPSWSSWSDTFTFRTPAPDAKRVTLSSPANGTMVANFTPTIQWSTSDPSMFYFEVQLSKDRTFEMDPAKATASVYQNLVHGAIATPTNSYTVPTGAPLEPSTTYYWRVRPRVQGDGTSVAWPDAATFRTPAVATTPVATATASATAPAVPSASPVATDTPVSTATVAPTATTVPATATAVVTATAAPATATPTAPATGVPSATASATSTPSPTATATSTATVVPTATLAPGAAATTGKYVADLGFRPAVNGFNVPNYGSTLSDGSAVTNMTAAEMRRLFGDRVCASVADGKCHLSPPAQKWMEATNKEMTGGHCEGFAALSLLFYTGQLKTTDFGGTNAHSLPLRNERLQREIALWWATQAVNPTANPGTTRRMAPNQVVDTLTAAFKTGASGETYTLGIYQRSGEGGHAILPYAIEERGNNVLWIVTYDNNWPDVPRAVEVNRAANTWRYVAATNPNEPSELYDGDATSGNLELTATSARLKPQACPFCGGGQSSLSGSPSGDARLMAEAGYQEVQVVGGERVLITDRLGRRLGRDSKGNRYDEIPGAVLTSLRRVDTWLEDQDPIFQIPLGIAFTITLDAGASRKAESTDVYITSPGHDLTVEEIVLRPGQVDTLKVSGDGTSISYSTTGSESPFITIGDETAAGDWEFEVRGVSMQPGSTLQMQIDEVNGTLSLLNLGGMGPSSYSLYVDHAGKDYDQEFSHGGISLGPNDRVTLTYGDWTRDKEGMLLAYDHGNDGTDDEVVLLTNEK